MELESVEYDLTVCKIDSIEHVDFTSELVFLSKTADEISLVCETDRVPQNTIESEPGWKALKVAGVLDFGMIGVVAKISNILAESRISIFVVSTYNTDYVLMKSEDFDSGVQALEKNGYIVLRHREEQSDVAIQ